MRTTMKFSLAILGLALGLSVQAEAQATTSAPTTSVTCVVRAVVSSFVRVTMVPADPATGAPAALKVVTNDPRIRASLPSQLAPETIGPESMVYETDGTGRGGEAALKGHLVAGPTTLRYTITTP